MQGLLVVISAPSGVGKSTIIRHLLSVDSNCVFSVSHTTRPPRAGEEDGVHYHFVDDDTFTQIQQSGGFVEWAHVHSNRYGTSVAEVERLRALGRDVIFEVDFQGGRSLMRSYPDAVSIFVLPPSMAEVRSRLVGRGTDDEAAISLRLNNARVEIATAGEYRYNVTNEVLEHAIEDVLAILRAERLRSTRCTRQIRDLVAEEV